ncbi:hypothetical protein [Pseudomonas kurunegalensis]|uniref:hypothetical protein n=1 Tax=Pseudomonas kurunegalensis TaxID=485880 RepID=UPI002364455F|nr:hypothetical protein [Pseudomonas kurunegalensis]MDD2133223.1 hypothetical protein [Pseudomonas kurunegalensis]
MSIRFRDELPKYSDFFRTEHDEQRNVASIAAHYSVLSIPSFISSTGAIKIQRVAIIWDADHDERVIDVLEAAYFENLVGPVLFIGEYKGAVSVIVNSDRINKNEISEYEEQWRRICDDAVQDDKFRLDVMTTEEYVKTADEKLQPILCTYLKFIKDAWGLEINHYFQRPARKRLSERSKRTW